MVDGRSQVRTDGSYHLNHIQRNARQMDVRHCQHHRNHDIQFGIVVLTQQKRGGLI